MQKKLENAYYDGIQSGAEDAHSVWLRAIKNTSGIGPVLQARLVEQAKIEYVNRKNDKEAVQALRDAQKSGGQP